MEKLIQNLSHPSLPEAIEANFAEEMLCFGYGLPGGEVHKDQELLWFYTGRPNLNGVLLTHFAHDDKAYIDAKITATLDYFKARRVEVGWSVGPSTRPHDLATYLEAHGFVYAIDTIGLALDISALHENVPLSTRLAIQEAVDRETLQPLYEIERQGFNATAEIAQIYFDTYLTIGFGKGQPWHHYIGYLDGKAVAITSLLLHAGIAGIFGVTTIPEARKQGVGATMTIHTLHKARSLGYSIAAISPTELSEGIYERLGFQEYCRISHYGWSPI